MTRDHDRITALLLRDPIERHEIKAPEPDYGSETIWQSLAAVLGGVLFIACLVVLL